MIYGRAFILGAKYPSVVKRSRAKHKALLWNTRDDFIKEHIITKLLRELAQDKKTESIELYGLWDDNHRFSAKDKDFVIKVGLKFNDIARATLHKKFYYAPFLEHELDKKFMLELFRELAPLVPNLELVNNPSGKGQFLDDVRYIDELHISGGKTGKPKKRFFISVDGRADSKKGHGNGSVDMDHQAQVDSYPGALVWMDWVLQDNGKKNTKDETARKDRKAWLTTTLDDSVCFLFTERGEHWIKKGDLWKSHAEQHGSDADNLEANRPVYISSKKKYKRVAVQSLDGKTIEVNTNPIKDKHGEGYLYRFKKWGFKMAHAARGFTGKPTCLIVADGEIVGRLNCGFRIPGR